MMYLGVKVVEAYLELKDGIDGYKVIYDSGYVSWCPKDAFESSNIFITDRTDLPLNVIKLMGQRAQQLEYIHEIASRLTGDEVENFSNQYIDSLSEEIQQRNRLVDIITQRLTELGYAGV